MSEDITPAMPAQDTPTPQVTTTPVKEEVTLEKEEVPLEKEDVVNADNFLNTLDRATELMTREQVPQGLTVDHIEKEEVDQEAEEEKLPFLEEKETPLAIIDMKPEAMSD